MPYKDPEKKKAYDKAYHEDHKEERKAYFRAYHKPYYEDNKKKVNARNKAYYKANKAEHLARCVKYNALKMPALLPTTDNELIKNLYKQRADTSKKHGEEYHVDHIIPLSIGGAHHQDNMRIITAKENLEKSAKYIPELGGVWADNKLARKNRKKYEAL